MMRRLSALTIAAVLAFISVLVFILTSSAAAQAGGQQSSDKQAASKPEAHAQAHPDFAQSVHGKAAVGCKDCHSVRPPAKEVGLLKQSQPALCYGCHADIKPSFAQAFHHKVDEGSMSCSDCHDPHAAIQANQRATIAGQNTACIKCHAEQGGPFRFEHPVVATEGCIACHAPHGSPNRRLLKRVNVTTLCSQCHVINFTSDAKTTVGTGGTLHSQAAQNVACTNCHTEIHGSDVTQNFLK